LARDFLEALIAYTETVPALAGRVFMELAPPPDTTVYPFIVIANYDEHDPGVSLDDQTVTLTLIFHHSSLDELKAFSREAKAAIDSPAINRDSTRTAPLAWDGGQETGVVRGESKVRRLKPTAGGIIPWREAVDSAFWITPV
jgi:hypothetical protein